MNYRPLHLSERNPESYCPLRLKRALASRACLTSQASIFPKTSALAATVLAKGVVCLYPRNLSSSPKSVHTPMKRCTKAGSHLYILRHWNLLGQALAKDHSVHHWGTRLACTSTLFLDPKTFNAFQCKWNVSQNCWIFMNQHTLNGGCKTSVSKIR